MKKESYSLKIHIETKIFIFANDSYGLMKLNLKQLLIKKTTTFREKRDNGIQTGKAALCSADVLLFTEQMKTYGKNNVEILKHIYCYSKEEP